MYNTCTDFYILNAYLVFYWQITDSVYQSSSWITSPAWPPFVSGIAVGSLQIPVVLVIGDTLGIVYSHKLNYLQMYCELMEFHGTCTSMPLFTWMFKCTMKDSSVYVIFPCVLCHWQEPAVASVPLRLSFFFTSPLRDYHLIFWNSNQALKIGGRYRILSMLS